MSTAWGTGSELRIAPTPVLDRTCARDCSSLYCRRPSSYARDCSLRARTSSSALCACVTSASAEFTLCAMSALRASRSARFCSRSALRSDARLGADAGTGAGMGAGAGTGIGGFPGITNVNLGAGGCSVFGCAGGSALGWAGFSSL